MEIRGYGATDTGRVRDHNEDSLLLDNEMGLYLVADGVGGHSAGEVASAMLVENAHRLARTLEGLRERFLLGNEHARRQLLKALPRCIQQASDIIFRHAVENPECQGMATTAVAFYAAGDSAFVTHVGDSRMYLLRGQHFRQITEDHTLVRKLVKEGALTPEEAAMHPQRNVIIRSVGMTPGIECDALFVDIRPNDLFILCSDGLTDMVDDDEIHELALRYHDDSLVTALIQRANARGGRDNVTVLVVEVEGDEEEADVPGHAFDLIEKVEFLEDVFMFKTLTEGERIKVNRCLYEQVYKDGEAIVRLDEEGDDLFIVAEGTCVVEKHGVVLVEIPPGGHFGELAFISRDKRSATVRARGDVTCFAISRDDLHELLADDAVLGNKLLWAFLENLGSRVKSLSIEVASLKARLR